MRLTAFALRFYERTLSEAEAKAFALGGEDRLAIRVLFVSVPQQTNPQDAPVAELGEMARCGTQSDVMVDAYAGMRIGS